MEVYVARQFYTSDSTTDGLCIGPWGVVIGNPPVEAGGSCSWTGYPIPDFDDGEEEEVDVMAIWVVYVVALDEEGEPSGLVNEYTLLASSREDAVLRADRAELGKLKLERTKFVAVKVAEV
jgi:hypothetical protein